MLRNKIAAVALLAVAAFACKKEKEYTPYPFNEITAFNVTADEQEISAAITTDSVVLYWPSWENMPTTIKPLIKVSENASISPASGESIELKEGVAYTVKAQDGTTKKYYLKLVVNQPDIWINEDASFAQTEGASRAFEILSHSLRYIVPDAAKTRISLLDAAGTEYALPTSFPASYPGYSAPVVKVNWPAAGVPVGAYRMKIVSGTRTKITAQAQYAIVHSKFPTVDDFAGPVTVKRGETITFTGKDFVGMQDAQVFTYTEGWVETLVGKLQYVSHTATSVVYRVPLDFPKGNYKMNEYDFNIGIWLGLRTSDFFGSWNFKKPVPQYLFPQGTGAFTITD